MIHGLAEFETRRRSMHCHRNANFSQHFSVIPRPFKDTSPKCTASVAAMALWFLNFSTWDGVAGIYLEDLFVRPRFRRRGLARALLAALAGECLDNGYTRLSWAVLNWNTDAIALYDGVGAQPQREWTTYRVSGPPLAELAGPR